VDFGTLDASNTFHWPFNSWDCDVTCRCTNGPNPTPFFTTEQNMSFNRLSGIPPRERSMPTLVCARPSSQASFVIWPLAPLQGPWQEIYRIAHEKAQATMLPEPTVRFACWN
jgi:hypothetical protein